MDTALILTLEKLNKFLDVLLGDDKKKRGIPNQSGDSDKKGSVLPSEGGTFNPSTGISTKAIVQLGTTLGIGKFASKSNIIANAKNFAEGFLPELKPVLNAAFLPITEAIQEMSDKVSGKSGEGEKRSSSRFQKFQDSVGAVAKNLLIFIPALIAFTFVAKEWSNIEMSAVTKLLVSFGAFVGGIVLLSKNSGKFNLGLKSLGILLVEIAGLAGVLVLFKKALTEFNSVSIPSLTKATAVVGGVVSLAYVLAAIPKKSLILGGLSLLGIEALMLGLSFALPPLSAAIKSVRDITQVDLLKVLGIVGGLGLLAAGLGALALLSGGGTLFVIGGLVIAGAGVMIMALSEILPPLAQAMQTVKTIDPKDMVLVGRIINGFAIMALGLGVLATLGGAPFMAIGAAIILGVLGLIVAINRVLPPLVQTINAVKTITKDDLSHVGMVLKGIGGAFSSLGISFIFTGVSTLALAKLKDSAIKINEILPEIRKTISLASGISKDGINRMFDTISAFYNRSIELFVGKGFFGKLSGIAFSIFGGSDASSGPYVALAKRLSIISKLILETVTNTSKIGSDKRVDDTIKILKSFFGAGGIFSSVAPKAKIIEAYDALTTLVGITPNIINLSSSLLDLQNTIVSFETNDLFKVFGDGAATIDKLTQSTKKLKDEFNTLQANTTINVITDRPLKVDMSATNQILTDIYKTSLQMVAALQKMPGGGANNYIMQQPQGAASGSGIRTIGPDSSGYSGSRYNYSAPSD